jgi:hypothetical protein
MKKEHKIGDRVKVINVDSFDIERGISVGDVGIIKRQSESKKWFNIELDATDYPVAMYNKQLTPSPTEQKQPVVKYGLVSPGVLLATWDGGRLCAVADG